MTYARKALISLQDTPYYHVVARCVRRAWLWGVDPYAGKDYSHRKAWVLERLKHLSHVFAIDLCAYAVMKNHYHLVIHVDQRRASQWSVEDVIDRWTRVFSTTPLVQRWQEGICDAAEAAEAQRIIERWRRRLCDVSWYMRCLNEHLARRANAEDGCTGRFWEGRFKSQALLDERGLLTAMAYVDLNPVRAGIAPTPETSEFTSIAARIEQLKARSQRRGVANLPTVPLLKFADEAPLATPCVPFSRNDYFDLVDWTGRSVRADKRGAIDMKLPAIAQRLGIDATVWRQIMRPGGNVFGRALGAVDRLRAHAERLGQSWVRGLQRARQLYGHG